MKPNWITLNKTSGMGGGESTVAVTAEINNSLKKRVSNIEVKTKDITKQLEVVQNPSFIYDIFDKHLGIHSKFPLDKAYSRVCNIAPDNSGIIQAYGHNRYNQVSICFIIVRKGELDVEFKFERTGPHSIFTVQNSKDFTYNGNKYTVYSAEVKTLDSVDIVTCKSKNTGITLLKFILTRE